MHFNCKKKYEFVCVGGGGGGGCFIANRPALILIYMHEVQLQHWLTLWALCTGAAKAQTDYGWIRL